MVSCMQGTFARETSAYRSVLATAAPDHAVSSAVSMRFTTKDNVVLTEALENTLEINALQCHAVFAYPPHQFFSFPFLDSRFIYL